jgi:hypothetical protein
MDIKTATLAELRAELERQADICERAGLVRMVIATEIRRREESAQVLAKLAAMSPEERDTWRSVVSQLP